MAERIYTIKSGLKVEPMAAPAQSASVGAAGSVGDVASYNANTAGVPTANVAEVASAGQTAGRVYRKKSSLTAGAANIPTATSQRTYTPKLSVRMEQAKNLQGMWDWLDEANTLIQSTIEYTNANEGKWVSGYASEYTDRLQKLLQSYDTYAPYIDFYKGEEAYSALTQAFKEFKSYLGEFDAYAAGMREHYGQYATEADYNKAVEDAERWQADAAELEQSIDKLTSDYKFAQDLQSIIEEYDYWRSVDPRYYSYDSVNEHGEYIIGHEFSEAIVEGNLYDLEKKMDYYGIPYDTHQARIDYKKDLEKKLATYEKEYKTAKETQVINAAAAAQADPDYATLVSEGKEKYAQRYDGFETISKAMDSETKNDVKQMLAETENYDELFATLDTNQKDTYYYILGKYGHEEANIYFKLARNQIKQEAATEYYNKNLKGKWYQGLYSAISGLDRFGSQLKNAFGNTYTDDRVLDPQFIKGEVEAALGDEKTPIWYNFKEGKWETTIAGRTLAQIGFDVLENTSYMLPAMVAGGVSSLVSPALGATVQMSLTGLAAGGGAYKEAIDRGYEHYEAMNYAMLVGASEAVLDKVLSGTGTVIGGSVIGNAMSQATSGIKSAGLRLALRAGGSFMSEALEEGLQEVLVPFFENMALDADNTWSDIDWEQAGYAALLGGMTALSMKGVGAVTAIPKRYAQQNAAYRKLGKTFIQGKDIDGPDGVKTKATIDRAIEIGMDNAKGTDARIAAEKISEKVEAGKSVSPYMVGRMVAESQTEQAQTARAIERTVLSTAKEWNIPTDAAETVSAAAVSLGQKVEFVSPEEMHNRYMAGEYDSATGTVRLNAAERNVDKLIGAVLAHEMVHAAEGTDQLQKLAQIAERMENHKNGAGAWEKLQADVKSKYAAAGKQLSDPEVKRETLAHWIAENLFQNKAFAKAVVDGDANVGNAFFYMIDRVRRAMGAKKASAGNLAMLERLFMQALDNRTLGPREGDVQGAIVALKDGKIYVQADRKVLTGTDKEAWKSQIDAFFDNVLLQNGSLTVESIEGDELTITKDQTVWKGKDEHRPGTKHLLNKGQYYVKLNALAHVDELVEASMVDREKDGSRIVKSDKKSHPFAKDGFEYRTVFFMDFDGKYYKITMSVGLSDGVSTVYTVVPQKETAVPSGDVISVVGSKTLGSAASDTNVAQNAPDVNTHSMQEGAGISAQGALLSPESMEAVRNGTWRAVQVDEAAVLAEAMGERRTPEQAKRDRLLEQLRGGKQVTAKVRSQPQSKKVVEVDTSAIKKVADADAYIEMLEAELGSEELLRRMYNATRMDRPTGTVVIDGKRVDAGAYMDAYERSLPKDKAALERHIKRLQEQRTEEMVKLEQEGALEDYHFGGLKIDLQLFAATRMWDLLQLDAGENGTEVRQFYEKRLRGTDAIHNQELIDMLATNEETYDPIANEKTLEKANSLLRDSRKQEKLLKRIGRYNPRDMFSAVEMAAAQVMIKDAINDGEIGVAADLITGLSRKGTEAGRAVQALSMMARLTPEGTLKAAIKTVKADADYAICEGANEGLDVLADDIARAIKEAEGKGLTSDEIADRIRNGVVGRSPMTFHTLPPAFAAAVQEDIGTDVSQYKMVVDPAAMEQIINGGATDMVRTIIDTENGTLYVVMRDGNTTANIPTLPAAAPRLPRHMTREELVQLLSEDLAGEKGNFFTQEEIYDLLWKTVDDATNVPEQLKRYVLKKIRKDDGALAQRIYELHKRGDLKQVKLRRAMEEALELPHLTDEDLLWIAKQGAKIESLQDKPVEQADAMEELYDYLGAKLTVTGLDKWQAWRKFGMLFNVKTHLRNIFSNAAYADIRKADDAVAMVLERIFVRDPNQRGAALGWRYTKHGKSILPQLQERAELAVLEMQKRGAKYEQGVGMLKQKRKHFGESKVGEALNKANRWNSKWLEREDIWFFRPAYIDALGQIMTARKATEVTEDIHQIAMQRALEATFRADNAVSDVISSLKRFQNTNTTGKRLFGHGVDVVIPFHKTPANIAAQTVMHSPVGIVKGAFDLYNAVHGKGSKDAATAINTMAKGVTGTALLIIGMLLGQAGLFNTGFGKTEKERAADEMAGLQEGSFVIGGVSISLDWLQPAASPLIVGASIAERMNGDGFTIGDFFGAVMDGTDSLFEMTMLQSLYDILGGYDAGASGTLMSVGENLISQSVPTVVGQLARAIDPVQRKTKGDSDFETIVNQVMAKIPGLTYLLDPELDVWGNEVYRTGKPGTGTTVLNALQQVLIPANTKVGTGKGDPISEEILRLYADQGGAVIPTAVTRDEAAEIGEDYVDVNRLLGGANRLAVEEFLNNEKAYDVQVETGELTEKGNPRTKKETKYYRDMTDDERRRVLSRIYKATKAELTGDTEGKTESQLTDSERYIRDLLRRVREGERGTNDTVDEQAQQQPEQPKQEDTSYYEDLLRRMRNGY